jgi:hydroxyacylglutathione hydrolase
MLNIHSFTFNPFQENTYLIINDKKQCWVVDPGMYYDEELQQFNNYISQNQLTPQAIINTHAHIDHILGTQAVMDTYSIPFMLHEKDLPVLNSAASSAAMFGFKFNAIPAVSGLIKENEPLHLGDDVLEVRFAPGHSPGSIVFYYPDGKWAIGGDVLFADSIGRTDLPGGDHQTLLNSIRTQLFTLPPETTIYPGHGPETNIGREMQYNPFMQ